MPGGANGVNFSDWGPTNLDLLGTTTMPAGSSLFYQTNTILSTAATYDPRASNEAVAYSAAVAAGGDARNGASRACNSPAVTTPITSLEDLIARNPGSPCVLDGTAATGARNEWWSNSTFSIGVVNDALTPPAGTGSNYSSNARIRVAFPGGSNAVKFYSCLERASNGSTRNCDLIGTGSYRIESLGDARTMEFNGLPELGLRLDYRRVFVERGGKVYYGYRTVSGRTFSSVRLNLPAANAIFAQLGVPLLNPVD